MAFPFPTGTLTQLFSFRSNDDLNLAKTLLYMPVRSDSSTTLLPNMGNVGV